MKLFGREIFGNRGQGGFGSLVAAGIGLMILVIVIYNVVLPQLNTIYAAGGIANSTNLSGAALVLTQNVPLLTVLAIIFVPLAALAIRYLGGL